jgi:SAM-dependent methyltransferase
MFKNYYYVAGTSPVNVEHFRKYAVDMVKYFDLKPGNKVLDIASNDGTLLKHFKDLKMSILGIDPAKNLADEASKNGIPTIPEFFTEESADEILSKYGKFDLITANNVFAHIPDMIGFAKGVKKLLKPNGVFSFEVSYFVDVCDKVLPDLIYHEHTSCHTVRPLMNFFYDHGMEIFDVEAIPNHGGSIRVFVRLPTQHTLGEPKWFKFLWKETDMAQKVEKFQKDIDSLGKQLRDALQTLKSQDKSISIYGFPAKATTLICSLGIDENMIDFAVDDAILKQGTFTPGKHIPVYSPQIIYEKQPDYLLVLAWNFAESIIEKCKANSYKGKFIVPLPEFRII